VNLGARAPLPQRRTAPGWAQSSVGEGEIVEIGVTMQCDSFDMHLKTDK